MRYAQHMQLGRSMQRGAAWVSARQINRGRILGRQQKIRAVEACLIADAEVERIGTSALKQLGQLRLGVLFENAVWAIVAAKRRQLPLLGVKAGDGYARIILQNQGAVSQDELS